MFEAFIHKAKKILSDRKATAFILLLVTGSRIIQLLYFYNIVVDASYQVIGTQSLLDGHGVSLPNVLFNNLSETVYTPLINWPPGYSFLLAPFYSLFGNNYIAAGLTIDILSAVALIFICRSILKVLNIPLYLRNIFTLLTGFFIYYFYYNPCSDAIAITFLLCALYFSLLLIKSEKKQLLNTAGLTFFLLSAGVMKYLFIPVVFVIPAFLFLKGYADSSRQLKKAGIASFLVVAILLSMLLIYQKSIAGSATYISAGGRGFFPENLLVAYPTFPSSFLKPDTLALQSAGQTATGKLLFTVYQFIYVIVLIVFTAAFCRRILKYGFKNLFLLKSFFVLSFLLSLSIIILLAVLSLLVEKERMLISKLWTYIEDGRYYGLPNVLMHLSVFAIYKLYAETGKRHLKYIVYFFLLLMVPEMLRGIYFDIKRLQNLNKEEYTWQYENRLQQYADAVIRNVKQENPGSKIVFTGTWYYYNHRVIINSHVPPITDVEKIKDFSSLNTKSPVIIVAMLESKFIPAYQPFILQEGVKKAGNFDSFNFYTVKIEPH